MRISAAAFEAGRWEEHVKKGVLSFICDCIVSGEIRFQGVLCFKRKKIIFSINGNFELRQRRLRFSTSILQPVSGICYQVSQWVYFRVDMSKALHFAYTSHGKSLTKTLLTYTLTWSKMILFSFTKRQKNITKS